MNHESHLAIDSCSSRSRRAFGAPLARWVRIFVASVMLTTAAGALVTHDVVARWDVQARLQTDATRMAIAGAEFLPYAPARAVRAAARSAELHGLGRAEVVRAEAASDRMSFSVTLRQTAPVLLFRLLGSAGSLVTVNATATVHPYVAPRRSSGGRIALSANAVAAVPSAPCAIDRAAAFPDSSTDLNV